MAYRILSNQERGTVKIHTIETSGSIVVVGNTSTSDVALGLENIQFADIRSVICGTSNNAHWEITRGTNTVFVGTNGVYDLSARAAPITLDNTGTLTITLSNGSSGDGFIIVELSKTSN